MTGVVTGNAATDEVARKQNGGWFVGHFIDAGGLRQSGDVEVKWGIHRAGDRNPGGFVANKSAKSMSVMVAGHFRLHFRDAAHPDANQVVDLDCAGSYVVWDKGVEHDWEAVTDCTVLTVRWPSVPKDQG